MKKAFSLIELLISLITISVIMAAMAPVITHKLKHGGVSIGTKKLSMKCPATVGSDCTLCLGNQCIACPIGCGTQFKNTLTCKCETCTVANCANCASGVNGCDRCKAGYQKSGNSCVACPSGQYSTEGGTCQKCPKGSKANSSSAATGCTTCDGANQYQDSEGQTTCKTCSGFVHNNYKSCTSCNPGTYWNSSSCVNCSSGHYSSSANATSCSSCSAGTYQPNAGQTTCLSCNGSNQYQDTAGQTSCKTCGANSAPNSNHTSCTSTCQTTANCTGNQYLKDNCTCTSCSSGQVPTSDKLSCYTPSTAPTSCKDGEYLANDKCNPCPSGCTKCSGETSCTECKNATDYKLVNGVCKEIKRPMNQSDCSQFDAIFIPTFSGGKIQENTAGVCMTKRNAGDAGGPTIEYSEISRLKASGDGYGTCPANTACCWIGAGTTMTTKSAVTSNGTTTYYCTGASAVSDIPHGNYSASDYEGCKRTVCNYAAAEYACAHYKKGKSIEGDWTLPDKTTVSDSIYNIIRYKEPCPKNPQDSNCHGDLYNSSSSNTSYIQNYKGSEGLQLCSGSSIANPPGAARCYGRFGGNNCAGSYIHGEGNACVPAAVWVQDGLAFSYHRGVIHLSGSNGFTTGTISYKQTSANTITTTQAGYDKRSAFSTRCILKGWVE